MLTYATDALLGSSAIRHTQDGLQGSVESAAPEPPATCRKGYSPQWTCEAVFPSTSPLLSVVAFHWGLLAPPYRQTTVPGVGGALAFSYMRIT